MTAEGVFPKIDGDVLYASEVNRFGKIGYFIGAGSSAWLISGTAAQNIGSYVISAGSLANPCIVKFTFTTQGVNSASHNRIYSLTLSGLSSNATIANAAAPADGGEGQVNAGSPFKGLGYVRFYNPAAATTIYSAYINTSHLDTSAKLVINRTLTTDGGGAGGSAQCFDFISAEGGY